MVNIRMTKLSLCFRNLGSYQPRLCRFLVTIPQSWPLTEPSAALLSTGHLKAVTQSRDCRQLLDYPTGTVAVELAHHQLPVPREIWNFSSC